MCHNSTTGKRSYLAATESSWAERWRCCHNGVRFRGSLRGRSSERAAGAKIAALLRSNGVRGQLTSAQAATAITDVTARLARRHVRRSQLPARALVARAIDLVAAFGLG